MTPEQRYLFDLQGYLHIEAALSAEELAAARAATARYIGASEEELPEGFSRDGRRFVHGFAFDPALERLVFHRAIWPIVLELTRGKPMLVSGTLQVDDASIHTEGLDLHCARDDFGWESTRYEVRDGRIYCDDIAVFPYFDDVHPGDGGLVVLPGSHKSLFERPRHLFDDGHLRAPLPAGLVNIQPRAGDLVVMTEGVTHGTLPWSPTDRCRRSLVLRYRPQHRPGGDGVPAAVRARLAPETRELLEPGHYTHVKGIAGMDRVELSAP